MRNENESGITIRRLRSAIVAALLFLFAGVGLVGCTNPESGQTASPDSTSTSDKSSLSVPKWNPIITWDIETTEGTYQMPESIVFLVVDGLRIPVADGPGLSEMSADQRKRFKVPEDAVWAAAGYYAGFGVNLIAEQTPDSLIIMRSIWDEQADPALAWNYERHAAIADSDLKMRLDEGGLSQTLCYSGKNGTTTSEFRLKIHDGMVESWHDRTVEDHAIGYFTSAQSTGKGVQVGAQVYISLVTKIEYDTQKAVEIWTLTPEGLIFDSHLYSACP